MENNIEQTREDYEKGVYRLRLFYRQFIQLLEDFYGGYLVVQTDEINTNYLRLCSKIHSIVENPGFEKFRSDNWNPIDNLASYSEGDEEGWSIVGRQECGNFLSIIEKEFISLGEKVYPLEKDERDLLNRIQSYSEQYREHKKKNWDHLYNNIERQAEATGLVETTIKFPQIKFDHIGDEEIKGLLVKDWEEIQTACQNGLYKATVILCGTIIESLLIDALYHIKEESKFAYYQKYLESKHKESKPPEIEHWDLWRLIEIAKQKNIISSDAAKLSHIVKDYRNLIHNWCQKREQLKIDLNVASAIIHLLSIIYSDIVEWKMLQEKSCDRQ